MFESLGIYDKKSMHEGKWYKLFFLIGVNT